MCQVLRCEFGHATTFFWLRSLQILGYSPFRVYDGCETVARHCFAQSFLFAEPIMIGLEGQKHLLQSAGASNVMPTSIRAAERASQRNCPSSNITTLACVLHLVNLTLPLSLQASCSSNIQGKKTSPGLQCERRTQGGKAQTLSEARSKMSSS